MYICIYICTCIYTYGNKYLKPYIYHVHSIYMYVNVHHICACVYRSINDIRLQIWVHINTCLCIYMYTLTWTYTHVNKDMLMYIHMDVSHVHLCVHVQSFIHSMCIYAYTSAYFHTAFYEYTYIQSACFIYIYVNLHRYVVMQTDMGVKTRSPNTQEIHTTIK